MNVIVRWYFFIVVLAFVQANAQDLPVLSTTSLSSPGRSYGTNGNYAKDYHNLRGPYVGTWRYNQGGVNLIIKMSKLDKVLNKIEYQGVVSRYNYKDKLELRYRLVVNGTVLFDNLTTGNVDPITSYGIARAGYDLNGRILDHTRNVVGSFTAKSVMISGQKKMLFNLYLGNYTMINPRSYYQDGQPLFSIPTGEIEMVKID